MVMVSRISPRSPATLSFPQNGPTEVFEIEIILTIIKAAANMVHRLRKRYGEKKAMRETGRSQYPSCCAGKPRLSIMFQQS